MGTCLGQEAYEVGVVPLVGTCLGQGACEVGVAFYAVSIAA